MLHPVLRSPLQPVLRSPFSAVAPAPFNKFISALLSKSGRVAAYYGTSWDEIIEFNANAIASGHPENCVAFEDSAGTIPLLAPLGSGKGCGLLKDRSGGSNHRIQTSATARGEMSRRVNKAEFSEDISNTYWEKARGVITHNAIAGPVGISEYADLYVGDSEEPYWSIYKSYGFTWLPSTAYVISRFVKPAGETNVQVGYLDSFAGDAGGTSSFSLVGSGAVTLNSGGSIGFIEALPDGWYNIGIRFTTIANPTVHYIDLCSVGADGDGVRGFYITAVDIRTSSDAIASMPAYQAVRSPSDYDEEGFPAKWNLKTDDWANSSINPAGANRAFVLTALRVNSSASLGVLAEYGPTAASTDDTFSLESLSSQITLRVRGASAGTTVTASVADSSYVVIGALIDLASPRQELFVNGVSAGVSTEAIGATTFVARDLFVGARNGTSAFADAGYTAPLMAVFMQPGDPGLTGTEIARLTREFKKSIGAV